jgi:hypothetical protein
MKVLVAEALACTLEEEVLVWACTPALEGVVGTGASGEEASDILASSVGEALV